MIDATPVILNRVWVNISAKQKSVVIRKNRLIDNICPCYVRFHKIRVTATSLEKDVSRIEGYYFIMF